MPLRIAIISTPRTGNTWLMCLLSGIYGVPHIFKPKPADVDWEALPSECVLVTHARREPSLVTRLERERFRVVVLARHPLDVLISSLHFAASVVTDKPRQRAAPLAWPIVGAMPRSTPFLEFATGEAVSRSLAISASWWWAPGVRQVRYEDLARDPQAELARLAESLGAEPTRPIPDVVAQHTICRLRELTGNDLHFWKGEPGLWKRLLPASEVTSIAETHRTVFSTLGFACDPDPALDGRQADANWIDLVRDERIEEVRRLQALRQASAELGPTGIMVARALRRLSCRYPRLSALGKRILRLGR